ncbi:MAG: hypothetical protein GX825_08830 [Syntrophomonadaceae bacterium]|nr:hypothetical protein [Syntrophomonadaceae bacterium]
MFPDLNSQEIQLLTNFNMLTPDNKREILEYMKYVSSKQYRAEIYSQVLNNPLLHSGLMQALRMCEREDTGLDEINNKISQLKYMYYNMLEKTNHKYEESFQEARVDDLVKDWACIGFENVLDAVRTRSKEVMARELEEMIDRLTKLTKKDGKRRIIAV